MTRVRGMCVVTQIAWVACALSVMSCAAFVDKQDYAAYRRVRLAPTEDARLLAAEQYVRVQPQGHWRAELSEELRQRESRTYEQGKATRDGLTLYLRAYPSGQFAAQARARLEALAQVEARKAQELAAAERAAQERRARDEELRRTWVTRFSRYWVEQLLSVSQWGAPIADIARLNPEFSRAFGRAPRPQCNATECVKHYRATFGVPVPGGNRLERTMEITLRLSLRDGRAVAVELLMPRRGFSRWFELEQRRPVVDEDPQMRAEAIRWAFDAIKPWLARLGDSRVELSNFVFEPVLAPSLGPTGEVTDTTAEDPSLQVQGIAAEETNAAPATLGEPTPTEPAPDMVIGPIVIPEQGHRVQATDAPATPTVVPDTGEVMTIGPIEAGPAPTDEQTMTLGPIVVGDGPAAEPAPPAASTVPTALPAQIVAVAAGELRVVLFAETAGGWDGLRVERVSHAETTPAVSAPRRRGRP